MAGGLLLLLILDAAASAPLQPGGTSLGALLGFSAGDRDHRP